MTMFALELYYISWQVNLPAKTNTLSFPSKDIIDNCNKVYLFYITCNKNFGWEKIKATTQLCNLSGTGNIHYILIKITVLCDIQQFHRWYQHFRNVLLAPTVLKLKTEPVCSSKMLIRIYETTGHYLPLYCNLKVLPCISNFIQYFNQYNTLSLFIINLTVIPNVLSNPTITTSMNGKFLSVNTYISIYVYHIRFL